MDTLIIAARTGEREEVPTQTAKQARPKKSRKAARQGGWGAAWPLPKLPHATRNDGKTYSCVRICSIELAFAGKTT
jgi:hypothetical protein